MMNFNYSGNPDSLIFDLDGTLSDTVGTYALVWNKYFEFYDINNHVTKSDLKEYMRLELNKYLESILPQFSHKKRIAIYKEVIVIHDELLDFICGNL
jgi:phosphoglycolate phosphatase-like HAD superfamily hydrolase